MCCTALALKKNVLNFQGTWRNSIFLHDDIVCFCFLLLLLLLFFFFEREREREREREGALLWALFEGSVTSLESPFGFFWKLREMIKNLFNQPWNSLTHRFWCLSIINKTCLKWKSKTRVASCDLYVQIYELWVQIQVLRVEIHELRVRIQELRVWINKWGD